MAKFGEGDERWIVENRNDGTNVNAWHWTEKDVTNQAKARLAEIMTGVELFKDDVTTVTISSLESMTGEVNVHTRKNKTMVLYEMNIKLKYKAVVTFPDDVEDEDFEFDGTIHMPEVETDDDDYEINIAIDKKKSDPARKKVRDNIKRSSEAIIKPLITQLLNDMKALVGSSTPTAAKPKKQASTTIDQLAEQAEKQAPKKTKKRDLKTINQTIDFFAPVGDLFECLMDEGRVSMYTQSQCQIDREIGGAFSLFGGSITGTNVDVVPLESIEQKWRFDNWPQGHFSTVKLTLDEGGNGTILTLKHTDIPVDEIDRVRQGWEGQFWARIKQCFGFHYQKK